MKKIIFLFSIAFLTLFSGLELEAQKIRDKVAASRIEALEVVVNNDIPAIYDQLDSVQVQLEKVIPDSFPLIVDGITYWLPVKDGKIIYNEIDTFIQENKGNWPTDTLGWINLIVLAVVGGKFTQAFVSARRIYEFLKPKLGDTLFIVGLVSLAVAFGITMLVGGGAFDYKMFVGVSGWTGFIAVFIYEKWIKKDSPEEMQTVAI